MLVVPGGMASVQKCQEQREKEAESSKTIGIDKYIAACGLAKPGGRFAQCHCHLIIHSS